MGVVVGDLGVVLEDVLGVVVMVDIEIDYCDLF